MLTASATVLRWLLKTLMLKKEVLPLTINIVVSQTIEMETCSIHCNIVKISAGKTANASRNHCKIHNPSAHAALSLSPPSPSKKKGAQKSK